MIKDENTGELLDADLVIEEIEDEIEELVEQIQAERSKEKDDPSKNKDLIKQNQEKIKEKNRELKDIQKRIQKLIDFENLIIIMLDTPQEGFFANIMSLMSHDTDRNQEYLYTDRT